MSLFFILGFWFTDHFSKDLTIGAAEVFSFITFNFGKYLFLGKFWSHRHSLCSPRQIKSLTKLNEENLKVKSIINQFSSHLFVSILKVFIMIIVKKDCHQVGMSQPVSSMVVVLPFRSLCLSPLSGDYPHCIANEKFISDLLGCITG